MELSRQSSIRMAAEILGVENHDKQIQESADYARSIKRNAEMLLEYHATLAMANRLEEFVNDCELPTIIDVLDLSDDALRPPFLMDRRSEFLLLRFLHNALHKSPIPKIEITEEGEVLLLALVYDDGVGKSILTPVDSSTFPAPRRTSGCHV